MVTTVVYLLCNLYYFVNQVFIMVPAWRTYFYKIDAWWVLTLKILFAAQGWFIPLMRLSEPYFYQILVSKIEKWWNSDARQFERLQEQRDKQFIKSASVFVKRRSVDIQDKRPEQLTTLETEITEEEEDIAAQMAPLFLFLASSLNVELVYIILSSLTKFATASNTDLQLSEGSDND